MASGSRLLFIRDAPSRDERDLCVRLNMHDTPEGIKWGDWIRLTFVDSGKSVVCRLQGNDDASGSLQLLRIQINSHLRNMLGLESDKLAAYLLHEFRIRKASSWGFFWYIYRYHPDRKRRAEVLLGLTLLIGSIALGATGMALAFVLR